MSIKMLKEREDVIKYSLKGLKDNITNGTAGNISIYNRDENLIAITPTGINYDELLPEDISIVDLNGNLIEGKMPSSELEMHLAVYRKRKDLNAVVHTHPIYATVLACLREDLPAIDYMIGISGDIKVPCAEYAPYGTKELADNFMEKLGEKGKAVILANHGLTTAGVDIANAYNVTFQVEYLSKLYVYAKSIGNPVILDEKEMNSILERFKTYGQIKKKEE